MYLVFCFARGRIDTARRSGAEKVATAVDRGAGKVAKLLGNSLQQSTGLVVCIAGYASPLCIYDARSAL